MYAENNEFADYETSVDLSNYGARMATLSGGFKHPRMLKN